MRGSLCQPSFSAIPRRGFHLSVKFKEIDVAAGNVETVHRTMRRTQRSPPVAKKGTMELYLPPHRRVESCATRPTGCRSFGGT